MEKGFCIYVIVPYWTIMIVKVKILYMEFINKYRKLY